MSAVIFLADRRPKCAYVQFVDAGLTRSQAFAFADHVRHAVKHNGESRQHAIDRLLKLAPADAPQVLA